ncbi:SGNH/GDSL hydrolase family protein [Leucothrix sargassi]|nr:SGNH/GDSL hydrolase family protein [Leucothrix sargassi]
MKIYKYLRLVSLSFVIGLSTPAYSADAWPESVEDQVTLTAEQRVYIPVLDNDIGEELVLFDVNTTTVQLGSVEVSDDNQGVYYQSANGFVGSDSFWYAFRDNQGRTNAAQVFITVLEAEEPPEIPVENDPYEGWPAAVIDSVEITKNESIDIPVLENDSGLGLYLTDVNTVSVKGGAAEIKDGKIAYTPYLDYLGEDSFWYQFTDARGRKNSTQVKVSVLEEVAQPPEEPIDPEPVVEASFERLGMHFDLLHGRSHIYGEQAGTYYMSLSEPAPVGSTQLLLAESYDVKAGQLITYLSNDGNYYTVETDKIEGNTLFLKHPLSADANDHVWNFYDNASHPNWYGYLSIADFALKKLDVESLNSGKHLMLGDSWFQSGGIAQRLQEKLPNATFVNKAVGGRTSGDILEAFEVDTESELPDVVWLIAGTNDYFQEVSLADYTKNMSEIIEKINNLGAKAIVFDSSVAPLMSGSDELTELSHSYSKSVEDLSTMEN